MNTVRWAIVAMGVFAATATFAVVQSGAFARLGDVEAAGAANRGVDGEEQEFRWTGRLAAGETLEIKGINGDVTAVRSGGAEVEVVAELEGRRSDPSSVRVERIEHGGGITFCAVYPTPDGERENYCAAGSDGRMSTKDNDVQVDFEVWVPVGVHLVARTVNGDVEAFDLDGDVTAETVNGDVEVSTDGFARARTVNGDIDVVMGGLDFSGGASFSTVNGSISLDVVDGVDADVRASWLNGDFESEVPFMLQGRVGERSARGVLGDGGPLLELETVNGSIRIR